MGGSVDIESKSLPAHVAACSERYRTLFNKLENLERRLAVWERHFVALAGFVIATLLTIAGVLAWHFILRGGA